MGPAASSSFLSRALERLPCEGEDLEELARELPPIAILARLLRVIDRAAAEPGVGRAAQPSEVLADELDAAAQAIADLWGPRSDWVSVAMRLDDPAERRDARAASASTTLRSSDQIAWEPMDDASVVSLVASASAAACGASTLDAIEAYPPLSLWLLCLGCGVLLRASEPEARLTLVAGAARPTLVDQGLHRSVVLTGLAYLRRAIEATFPGLAAKLEAGATPKRSGSAGPYRAHHAGEEALPPEPHGTKVAASPHDAGLEAAWIPDLGAAALLHATRAALCERAAQRLDEGERSLFRPDGAKVMAQRATAELAVLPTVRARAFLRVIHHGIFAVALHEAVVELHAAATALAVEEAFLREPIVGGLSRCSAALAAVTSLLALQLQLPGDESALAAAVVGHLALPDPRAAEGPFEELVHAVSVVLRGTRFAELHASLPPLLHEIEDADRGAAAADARLHWYDRISLLGESAGAIERNAHVQDASQRRRAWATTLAAVRGFLESALRSVSPQALAHYRTFDLRTSLGGVHLETVPFVSTNDAEAKLVGDVAFRTELEAWTREMLPAFGHLQSPGEVLERYAASRIERARSRA